MDISSRILLFLSWRQNVEFRPKNNQNFKKMVITSLSENMTEFPKFMISFSEFK